MVSPSSYHPSPRVRLAIAAALLLATAGLDDRKSSNGYRSAAEQLMADAVGAEQAFFSTCGSSLSVKAAMLAVAGGRGDLLVSRDAHKSVVAGLVFGGIQPQWIRPRYDEKLHLAHPPSPRQGDVALVFVVGARGARVVEGSLGGRPLHFFPYGEDYAALGSDWDWDGAERLYRRAIEIDPQNGAARRGPSR